MYYVMGCSSAGVELRTLDKDSTTLTEQQQRTIGCELPGPTINTSKEGGQMDDRCEGRRQTGGV